MQRDEEEHGRRLARAGRRGPCLLSMLVHPVSGPVHYPFRGRRRLLTADGGGAAGPNS
jgi:hypothetical protein